MSNKKHISEKAGRYITQSGVIAFKRIYVDIMGDIPGALWLSQLAYWQPRTKRDDGYIYKKYTEWENETGLTQYQVNRCAKKAEKMGIVARKLALANGAPTLHYKINYSALSDLINLIIEKLDNQETSQSDYEETSQSDYEETSLSLTETTQRLPETTSPSSANPPAGIAWAIAGDRAVTPRDLQAEGKTIDSQLANWNDDLYKIIAKTFATAFDILPPAAPKNKKDKSPFYWAWREGIDKLKAVGSNELLKDIAQIGREFDGGFTVTNPGSIANILYERVNKAPENFTGGVRIKT